MRDPWVGEWLFVPEGSLIVARYQVPGCRCRELPSRRDGRSVEVIGCPRDICPRNRVQAALATPGIPVEGYLGVLASNLSRDPFNRPAGTGVIFLMTPGTSVLRA
jgi:hypothetical protein